MTDLYVRIINIFLCFLWTVLRGGTKERFVIIYNDNSAFAVLTDDLAGWGHPCRKHAVEEMHVHNTSFLRFPVPLPEDGPVYLTDSSCVENIDSERKCSHERGDMRNNILTLSSSDSNGTG